MKKISLLVFDLDGTLVDSKNDITNAVNWTLAAYGLPTLAPTLVSEFVGTGVRPLLERELVKGGVSQISEAMEKFNGYYLAHLADETRLFVGMEEVLVHYHSVPKVILTNKSNRFVPSLLSRLQIEQYFTASYGRESFATHKPDPGPLLQIALQHQASLQEMVMIGDTDVDIRAGRAAGCLTCAVSFGFGSQSSLMQSQPHYMVAHPQELIGLFRGESP
jgi:phosphoglycolate phosphatase